jgi:hypothetical protein
MIGLRLIINVAIFMAFILVVLGDKNKRYARHLGGGGFGYHSGNGKPCTDNPQRHPYRPPCTTTPAFPPPMTESNTKPSTMLYGQIDAEIANSSSQSTALERAHWCRFSNGTYTPLGFTYRRGLCSMCRCLKSHAILCQVIECMATYCLDNKMPIRKIDQCCTQCSTDVAKRDSCDYNGISYPHGAVMKVIEGKMQCWCQLGDIECRKYIGSLFEGFSALTDGTTISIIILVVFISLFFGLLMCCGCTVFLYSYVQQNQQLIEQAYNEYAGTGGWQPITDEESYAVDNEKGYVVDEKYPYEYPSDDSVPPPYAIYDNSYVPTNDQKS